MSELRLSLDPTKPVFDGSGNLLHLVPYTGNRLTIFNGTQWTIVVPVPLSFNTQGLPIETVYDLFRNLQGQLYAQPWSNLTARSVPVARVGGRWVRQGVTTDRLLGTFYVGSDGLVRDLPTHRGILNYENAVQRSVMRKELKDGVYGGWGHSQKGVWERLRQSNQNRVLLLCDGEHLVDLSQTITVSIVGGPDPTDPTASNSVRAAVGIGMDWTAWQEPIASCSGGWAQHNDPNFQHVQELHHRLVTCPVAGLHTFDMLQYANRQQLTDTPPPQVWFYGYNHQGIHPGLVGWHWC